MVRLVTTGAATQLTGLSTNQLREWTSRRALIPADVLHRGRGSPAQYGWQTLLLLRIAAVLRSRFCLELQAHRKIFAEMRKSFGSTSFLRLWGSCIVIYGPDRWQLTEVAASHLNEDDGIILHLDSHLRVLSAEFGMSSSAPGQLELFPARLVRREKTASILTGTTLTKPSSKRRSA
ncbi:hypothetical protein FHX05_006190 [Rhizobium sp. BK491]|nr:hypothetical protein [Rhizobium sp. BK491]